MDRHRYPDSALASDVHVMCHSRGVLREERGFYSTEQGGDSSEGVPLLVQVLSSEL